MTRSEGKGGRLGQGHGVPGNSGTYYIVVHRDIHASGPAHYRFAMDGDGVTSPQHLD